MNQYLFINNVPVYSVSPTGAVKKIENLPKYHTDPKPSTLRRRGTFSKFTSKKEQKLHPYGLVIQCNDVQCIYEFRVFRKKPKKGLTGGGGSGERVGRGVGSNDDVPTDKLVSPLQSPNSLPNLMVPTNTPDNNTNTISRSHPLIVT